MIWFLLRVRKTFVELDWIKPLIDAGVISSAMGRTIEGAIFTVYAGIITFLITGITTEVWSDRKTTLVVLGAGFAKTILEAILKAIRDHKKEE
jgi:hypothetical protein